MRNGKEKEKKKVWLFTNYDKYEECTLYVCYNVVEKRRKRKKKVKKKEKKSYEKEKKRERIKRNKDFLT